MAGIIGGLARWITQLSPVPVVETSYTFVFGSGDVGPIPSAVPVDARGPHRGAHRLPQDDLRARAARDGRQPDWRHATRASTPRGCASRRWSSARRTAALAGLLYVGRLHSARYTLGEADLLTVIAAAVIGGTSMAGGRGSIIGALVGSLIMGVLNNGLILMGLAVTEQMIARGADHHHRGRLEPPGGTGRLDPRPSTCTRRVTIAPPQIALARTGHPQVLQRRRGPARRGLHASAWRDPRSGRPERRRQVDPGEDHRWRLLGRRGSRSRSTARR